MGVPLRLAPTPPPFSTGKSARSVQDTPVTRSRISVLVAEDGLPVVTMTILPVEPQKKFQINEKFPRSICLPFTGFHLGCGVSTCKVQTYLKYYTLQNLLIEILLRFHNQPLKVRKPIFLQLVVSNKRFELIQYHSGENFTTQLTIISINQYFKAMCYNNLRPFRL